jgi:hypothetical protein
MLDTRTKETLVGAVQDSVIQIYEDFFENYLSAQRKKGKPVSRKGKGHEDGVWDVDAFAEWSDDLFRVGVMATRSLDEEDGENMSRSRSASRSGSI